MSLYFAAHRWGNGKGIYNYQAQADKILRGMRHHPVLTATGPFRIHPDDPPFLPPSHPWPSPNNDARQKAMSAQGAAPPTPNAAQRVLILQPRTITSGAMTEEPHTMIRFVPEGDGTNEGVTDASYHLPAFYELWARWGPREDRAFWAKAADVSRQLFFTVTGPETGLTPERSNFDMTPVLGFNGTPATFGYDSWRSASNWSVDYSWWHKDPREAILSDRIQKFLSSQGIDSFADRYTLDGKPLSQRHSTGMLSTTAVGSFAATPGPTEKAFVEALWNTGIPYGEQRYYDGMLYLMSLLHCSGNFRIWPSTNPTH
jgi:oligosaccharide reducing-end xylanase